jgi:hypothetical protein
MDPRLIYDTNVEIPECNSIIFVLEVSEDTTGLNFELIMRDYRYGTIDE